MILRLLSYNIRYGGTGREGAIAACVTAAAPDVVVFQEATDKAVIERLAAATGLPHWGVRPGDSLGFISRIPVEAKWHRPRLSRHAFLTLAPVGTEWRVFGLHLSAVHAAWTERHRVYELRALVWLSGGKIRWRTIQTVLDAGYVDAYRHLHPDLVGNTFPTWDPHVRLDYLFVPGGHIANVRACEVLTPEHAAAASDHYPFFSELDC